jgi:AraC-like DNA-binding protein
MASNDTQVLTEYVEALLNRAKAQGSDVQPLLDDMNITQDDLEQRYFSAVKYGELYQRMMFLMQDECFGMMTGGRVQLGSFRLLCLTVIQCENLRQSIIRAGQFAEICRGFRVRPHMEEGENPDLMRVKMAPIKSISQQEFDRLMAFDNAEAIRTQLAVWHRFHCWLIGKETPLESVHFAFPCPDQFRSLAETYPAQIKFDQPFNGLEFEKKYLDMPIVQNQDTLHDFLRTAPYHLVIKDSLSNSLKSKVRAILSKDVSASMPSAEEVASRLNLSVTTLRRRLQQEETSYQKLKDDCRMEAAFHYLGCQDLTNSHISERLGFDETSAFFRAFKKWTGITPGEYRKRLEEGGELP